MPRRSVNPQTPVFVTFVTWRRTLLFSDPDNANLLLDCLRTCKAKHPFAMRAFALLPDHTHLLIDPAAGTRLSAMIQCVRASFTIAYRDTRHLPQGMLIWQKSFWDHVIRNDEDMRRHLDYVHRNPVAHGYVEKPEEWPFSSYGWWLENGYYETGWGWRGQDGAADQLDSDLEPGE